LECILSRPFKVLGVQQVAIGSLDKSRLRHFWVDILGLGFSHTYTSEKENVDEDICDLGSGPFKVEVDLMQPLDLDKKPRVDQPALNHIGLWIDDLPAAVSWLSDQGVRFAPGGIRKGASGFDITFVHPKGNEEFPLSSEGILLELVQAPEEVINAYRTIAEAGLSA
jgi:lactoylglutathione lyase